MTGHDASFLTDTLPTDGETRRFRVVAVLRTSAARFTLVCDRPRPSATLGVGLTFAWLTFGNVNDWQIGERRSTSLRDLTVEATWDDALGWTVVT